MRCPSRHPAREHPLPDGVHRVGRAALVRPDQLLFVTDGRYQEQSAEQLRAAGVEAEIVVGLTARRQREAVATATSGAGRLGLEAQAVTWAQQREFAADWFPGAELVATENLVEELRRVKDDGELDRVARA